ncbi:Sm-like protein LSM8 [Dirofilaria immitis]|nr:Sm-like protein LSM8 [Dirofilaria immitis]
MRMRARAFRLGGLGGLLSNVPQNFQKVDVVSMTQTLESFINKVISVITGDGRNIVGLMKGFDQTINLVLEDSHERVFSEDAGVEQIPLGLYIVRGDNVVPRLLYQRSSLNFDIVNLRKVECEFCSLIAVIGELDEDLDKRLDFSKMKAPPLGPEDFDDLICLDEEGESLESSINENLSEIKQQTRCSKLQSESRVNYRKKHDNTVQHRFPCHKQISSTYCCHEKTSNAKEMTLIIRVRKKPDLDQSSRKGENRVNVNHTNLESSVTLRIYGDDEDWPYLSGDVDEEAVRLAASLDPNAIEEAKDGPQQDSRKKWDATEKMTDKWNSKKYCNNNGSSHHSKTPDKLDEVKRPPRKFSPFGLSGKERRPIVHAHHEASHHIVDNECSRYRRQELMKYHEFPGRRDRMERISLFMSSQNRRKFAQTRAGPPLLYSRKTYVPYPSPCRKEETAPDLPKRSSGVSGVVIKRSYQITSKSLDSGAKKGRKGNSVHRTGHDKVDSDVVQKSLQCLRKTEHEEMPKKKLRWILTTEQFQLDEMKANFAEREGRNNSKAAAGHEATSIIKRCQETSKGNPIKLRLPNLSIT